MKTQYLAAAALAAAVATPAQAEQGDWLLRGRAILVAPTEDSGGIEPTFPNDEVSVSNSFAPEVDISYFVTDNIAFELIAATTKHDIGGKGSLDPIGKLADTWVLPPTLTAQYHFIPNGKVRPYVGAGLNYTLFYGEDTSSDLNAAIGDTDINLDSSFGFALQAGVDFDLNEKIFLNVDVKYLDIDTEAKLTTGALINRVDVDIDPIVFGIGLGMKL
jgi:outer membrane protein